MSLTVLPPELVSCVVANLAPDPPSLCNLARCSRQLYLCTVPHLYRRIKINEEVRGGEQHDGQLKILASVLIRRPDLAKLVRHFKLRVARYLQADHPEESESEEHVDLKMVEADQTFTMSEEEKINRLGQFSRTHKCHHDLILASLLPAILNVETLVVDVRPGFYLGIRHGTCYFEQMMQRAACPERPLGIQPPFEALTVFFHSHGLLSIRSTGFMASLLKLPAIREISGSFRSTVDSYCSYSGVANKNLIELDTASSSLTRLNLADYRLSAVDLGHILRAPKALKTLIYCAYPPAFMNFTDIRDALASQQNCLESLVFDCEPYCDKNSGLFRPLFGRMTSFANFIALKVFKVSAAFFEMTDNGTGRHSLLNIFPPNLETLHLTRFHASFERILEALEYLLEQKSPQQNPSWKKLILEEPDSLDGFLCRRTGFGPLKSVDVLCKGTQMSAIGKLAKVAAAQDVMIELIEKLTDEESTDDEFSGEEWEMDDIYESTDEEFLEHE